MENKPTMAQPTRKSTTPLKVYCLPEERSEIERLAGQSGLSVAAYLRNVGLGHRVPGILDNKRVEELARINGDLGRLGGLLKLWLTDDPKTAQFGESTIRALLSKIEATQEEMLAVMSAVVLPRSGR